MNLTIFRWIYMMISYRDIFIMDIVYLLSNFVIGVVISIN